MSILCFALWTCVYDMVEEDSLMNFLDWCNLVQRKKFPPVIDLFSLQTQRTYRINMDSSWGKIAMHNYFNWYKLSKVMKRNVRCHLSWHCKLSCQATCWLCSFVFQLHVQTLPSVFKSLTLTYTSHMPHRFSLFDCAGLLLPLMLGLFSVDLNLLLVLQQNTICTIFVQATRLVGRNANTAELNPLRIWTVSRCKPCQLQRTR